MYLKDWIGALMVFLKYDMINQQNISRYWTTCSVVDDMGFARCMSYLLQQLTHTEERNVAIYAMVCFVF